MSDTVIKVQGIWKEYCLGTINHGTLAADLATWWAQVRSRDNPNLRMGPQADVQNTSKVPERFWALKDINFEVQQGEVLGIIGRNGAGKSTLLKILSQVTTPTRGKIKVKGRIASLLEVGTGFHPELTGRENIFLNGAILGMMKEEIHRKLGEIIEFAGVETFIDTPVKRYSSGMYVRLAFAVAAHLEPEILVVDEVLAVGDALFQAKCLAKMDEVSKNGRTVLFVSHNLTAVQNLCTRAIVLDSGGVVCIGSVKECVQRYTMQGENNASWFADLCGHRGRSKESLHILTSITLKPTGATAGPLDKLSSGDDLIVEVAYDCGGQTLDYMVIAVNTIMNERVFTVGTHHSKEFNRSFCGKGVAQCILRNIPLVDGEYQLHVAIGQQMPIINIDYIENAIRFRVHDNNYFSTGRSLLPGQGHVLLRSEWSASIQ